MDYKQLNGKYTEGGKYLFSKRMNKW